MQNEPSINIIKSLIHSSIVSGKLSSILSAKGITIAHDEKATTASINFARQEIILPLLVNMTNQDVHMTMLCHETAHLMYSDMDTCISAYECGADDSYHNIILDIRDERLFKKDYPGFVKHFVRGYEEMVKDGFFGKVSEIPFSNFATRLNMFAKLGFPGNAFIPMSDSEMDFYNRCMLAETDHDVNRLAVELFAISRGVEARIMELLKNATKEELAALMEKFWDMPESEDDSMEMQEEQLEALYKYIQEETGDNDTKELLSKIINDLVNASPDEVAEAARKAQSLNGVSTVVYTNQYKGRVIPNKEFLSAAPFRCQPPSTEEMIRKAVEFKEPFKNSVKHMAMIFEARKAAFRTMNRKIHTDGQLDMNRIALYQVNDKLFRTRCKMGNAKNHGLVIALDCSGSISNMFHDMLEQVVTITEFCRAVSIPFKVYMFGAVLNQHNGYLIEEEKSSHSFTYGLSHIIEALSSDQSLADYHKSIYCLMKRDNWVFGSTPTIGAMATIEKILPKFFDRIDQRKLFVVTDGEPSDSSRSRGTTYVHDPITKTGFLNRAAFGYFGSFNAMATIFKRRYDVETTVIAIASTGQKLRSMVENVLGQIPTNYAVGIKEFGFSEQTTNMNVPALFVRSAGVEGDDFTVDVQEKDTVAAIKRKFSKNFGRIRKSKVFLNTLVDKLAL